MEKLGPIMFVLLAAIAGTGQPVQAAMNAQLRKGLGSPMLAAAVQFALAAVIVGACAAAGLLGRGTFSRASSLPWWAWLGGAVGAASVTVNLIAVSRVAAATTIASALVGQLAAAVVVDHFGWLGVERIPVNGSRIAGVVVLLIGVFLVQKRG